MVGKWQGDQTLSCKRTLYETQREKTSDLPSTVCGGEWDHRISIEVGDQIKPFLSIVEAIFDLLLDEGAQARI